MSNYKINIDKPLPADERINGYKDFDALYKEYQVITKFQFWRELYRNPKYFAALVAVVAVGFLVFQAIEQQQQAQDVPAVQAWEQPYTEVHIPLQSRLVDANKGHQLELRPGLVLNIPAQAFSKEEQVLTHGKIEIRYRELQDPAQLFLAGITTQLSTEEALTPLTILEIQAFQDGQPLLLATDKELEISYLTTEGSDTYAVYGIPEGSKGWRYIGKDEVEQVDARPGIPPKPEPPQLAGVRDLQADTLIPRAAERPPQTLRPPLKPFRIKADVSDFPELRPYQELNWVHTGESEETDPWANGIIGKEWDNVKLRKLQPRRYEITFTRRDPQTGNIERFRTIASPSYPQMTYEEAMAQYRQYLQQYEQALQQTQQDPAELEESRKAWQQYQQELREWEATYGKLAEDPQTPQYKRTFGVKQLGIYALARTTPTGPLTEQLRLKDESGADLPPGQVVYVAEPPALLAFEVGKAGQVELPAFTQHTQIWVPLPGNRLGVIPHPASSTRMQIVDLSGKDAETIRQLLLQKPLSF